MNTIKNLNRFSVTNKISENESITNDFATLVDAEKAYNEFAKSILDRTNSLERIRTKKGDFILEVELLELKQIPISEVENLKNAESDEEISEIWAELQFTYSERLKTKATYLSDNYNSETGEYIIESKEFEGKIYGTRFGQNPEMILIENE